MYNDCKTGYFAQFNTQNESKKEQCPGCENEKCQDCCPHDEHEHFMCLGCGKQLEPSDYYDEDYGKDR